MKRRQFIQSGAAITMGAAGTIGMGHGVARAAAPWRGQGDLRAASSFTLKGTSLDYFVPGLAAEEKLKVMVIADSHITVDDERGEPFLPYSQRMKGAYLQTKHFQTLERTHPRKCFVESLQIARKRGVDLIALVGDILNYPSEAGVEWVLEQMEACGVPFCYTAGNHDWHYEGMEGSLEQLRTDWIKKRLLPLYQGDHPLAFSKVIKGQRLVFIDNSTYEISPAQLKFFKQELAHGDPCFVFLHIPMYIPGREIGFGCGHPEWGAATDPSYEIERRPQWPESGHTPTTFAFHDELFAAPNVLGIFSGHVHRHSTNAKLGTHQFIAEANFRGGYLLLRTQPLVHKR